jgi:hypothetical protein
MYSSDAVKACRQVLNDIVHYLSGYEDKFYLIGGWSVYYLLDRPDRTAETIGFAGTEDVDLAFLLPMSELQKIMSALEEKGYERISSQRMHRDIAARHVIVDFLGGKEEIKDNFTFVKSITGATLSDEVVDVEVSVANLPACIALKAKAFDENPKDKDAYDIFYLVAHGGDKDGGAASEVLKVMHHPFISEATKILQLHFGRVEGRGLRAATQMLHRLEGRSSREAKALVRGSFKQFFTGLELTVNFD